MNRELALKYISLLFSVVVLTLSACGGSGSGQSSSSDGQNQSASSQQAALSLIVFGPQYYERSTGKPVTETAQFSVEEPDLSYTLHIYNGGAGSHFRDNVSSAVVQLNGEYVVTPDDFNKHTSHIQKPVNLSTDNTIKVELRGKPGSNMTIEIVGPRLIAAITDVLITRHKDFNDIPADYTGLAYGKATGPYVLGVIGEKVQSGHIYAANIPTDIWTSVWVKYDLLPQGSSKDVLGAYGVFREGSCPAGWRPATGNQGYLSYKLQFNGSIWPASCTNDPRVLCVRYEPMKQTDSFVTNVGLSNPTSTPNCATWGEANGGFWPMQTDGENMIPGCDEWRYMCYAKGKPWPPMPTSIVVTDEQKLALLQTYAPRVWMHNQEAFWPSSVEWAFNFLSRRMIGDMPWLFTKMPLDEPSSLLPFFHGCNGSATNTPCTLDEVPVYAFWTKKHNSDLSFDYVDLVYFFYYPYNLGKELFQTLWGNHVGDWEHLTVRLTWAYDDQSGWSLKPALVYMPAHDFGFTYEWDDISKINNTHPIIYSALGSHGNWQKPGVHVYKVIPVIEKPLFDETAEGSAWDTWNFVEAYDYDLKQGLSGKTWPV